MKNCLIVVDYQVDFVTGSLGFSEALKLEPFIADKIKRTRESGGEVIFTLDTHGTDYAQTQEGRNLPVAHCLLNTPGHGLYGEVAGMIRTSDPQFAKSTFGSDALFRYLQEKPFASIELVGVVSNICVLANAVLAKTAQPETPILVDARCTASNDEALHRAALDVMRGLQIKILDGAGPPRG